MSTITVGYWNIRGLVEPIHMYLSYKDIPFEKTTYTAETIEKWNEDKKNLGIDFANIPYIIHGDVKLCQSNSILKYLEKQFGSYYNGDIVHNMKLDVMLESIMDVRMLFTLPFYLPEDLAKQMKELQDQRLASKWEYFDTWLQDKKYLTGDNLCVADFVLWNVIDYCDAYDEKLLGSLKNLRRFKKDFESEPKVSAYLKDPSYKRFPIMLWVANWGGKDQAE